MNELKHSIKSFGSRPSQAEDRMRRFQKTSGQPICTWIDAQPYQSPGQSGQTTVRYLMPMHGLNDVWKLKKRSQTHSHRVEWRLPGARKGNGEMLVEGHALSVIT